MTKAVIEKKSLPDPSGDINIYSNTDELIGVLHFEKGTSRLELVLGQLPYRTYPLKRKYRAN